VADAVVGRQARARGGVPLLVRASVHLPVLQQALRHALAPRKRLVAHVLQRRIAPSLRQTAVRCVNWHLAAKVALGS